MPKTSPPCPELFFNEANKAEISVEPDIYFDEKDENIFTAEERENRKNFYTISNALFQLVFPVDQIVQHHTQTRPEEMRIRKQHRQQDPTY